MTENADLQSRNQIKDRELAEAQQQLREKVRATEREGEFFLLSRHCIPLTCRRNRWQIMQRSIPYCSSN